MDCWEKWLLGAGTIAAMVSIIPLMIWGGTGSLRAAWEAIRQFTIGVVVIVGGMVTLSFLAIVIEHGPRPLVMMLMCR